MNHETTPPYLTDQFKTYDQKVKLPKIISILKYVFQTEIWYRFQFYSQKLNLDFKSEIRNEIFINLKLFHIDSTEHRWAKIW